MGMNAYQRYTPYDMEWFHWSQAALGADALQVVCQKWCWFNENPTAYASSCNQVHGKCTVYLPHGFHVFLPWHIWHGHHLKGGLKPKGKPLSTLSTGGRSAGFKRPPQKQSLGLGIVWNDSLHPLGGNCTCEPCEFGFSSASYDDAKLIQAPCSTAFTERISSFFAGVKAIQKLTAKADT